MSQIRSKSIVVIILLLVAALFRFYNLEHLPPGLWIDEAVNGVDALQNIDSQSFKIFYPDNNGREGLFINLQTISVAIFGNTVWALRVVSALIGTLTIISFYFLLKELFSFRVSFISSYLLAISLWHVNFSRIGLRVIMVSLILTLCLYFLIRAFKTEKTSFYLLSGIFLGLGFYTYLSFRFSIVLIFALFLIKYLTSKKESSSVKDLSVFYSNLKVFIISFLITLLPFIYLHVVSFSQMTERLAQLSIFSYENPWFLVWQNFVASLGMFLFFSDLNLRHGISGQLILLPVQAIFFYIGLITTIYSLFKVEFSNISKNAPLILIWFFVMLLPIIFTSEGIHNLRALSLAPVVMLLCTIGYLWFYNKVSIYSKFLQARFWIITILILIILTVFEWQRYFIVWANQKELDGYFYTRLVEVSNFLLTKDSLAPTYIIYQHNHIVDGEGIEAQPVMYLTHTYNLEQQEKKQIFYAHYSEINSLNLPLNSILIFTNPLFEKELNNSNINLEKIRQGNFDYYILR